MALVGETKAIASVSGPIEVRLAAEQPSKATFEVIIRPLSNVPGTESKALSTTIRSLLTPSLLLALNPRTLIQLVIQSLSPSPSVKFHHSLIASFINVSSLALLNAGSVPMRGVTCAVAVGRLRSKSVSSPTFSLIVDPSEDELSSLDGGGCFAFLFATGLLSSPSDSELHGVAETPNCEAVWSDWHVSSSPFDENELVGARGLARIAAGQVWSSMKESVKQMGTQSEWKSGAHRDNLRVAVDDEKMEI
jgi:exosome complex component RRP46